MGIIITTHSNVVFWTADTSDPLGYVRQRVGRFPPETDPWKSDSFSIVSAHRKLSNSLWF